MPTNRLIIVGLGCLLIFLLSSYYLLIFSRPLLAQQTLPSIDFTFGTLRLWPVAWYSTYNGTGGGINGVSTFDVYPPKIDGFGGVFKVTPVAPRDLPIAVRELFIQAGAQRVTTAPKVDKDAPMTQAAFLSGPQGTNGFPWRS